MIQPRSDYRWEKIVRAVHCGRCSEGTFADAAERLILEHPEYPAHELPVIRETAAYLDEEADGAEQGT